MGVGHDRAGGVVVRVDPLLLSVEANTRIAGGFSAMGWP